MAPFRPQYDCFSNTIFRVEALTLCLPSATQLSQQDSSIAAREVALKGNADHRVEKQVG